MAKRSFYASISTIQKSIRIAQAELKIELDAQISPKYVPVKIQQQKIRLNMLIDLRERVLNGDTNPRPGNNDYAL